MGDNVIFPPANQFSRAEVEETLTGINGANVLGKLDDELISMYVRLANIEHELTETEEAIRASMVLRMSELTAARAHTFNNIEGYRDFYNAVQHFALYESEEQAEATMKLFAEWERLNATFWFDVRATFDVWNAWLEVRSDFRIVNLGKKFNQPS